MANDSTNLDFADAEGLSFFVPGIPAPGGSKRFVGHSKRTGRAILIDAAGERNKNWRAAVAHCASLIAPSELYRGALRVDFRFVMPRPKAHYHTSKKRAGLLREDAPHWHTVKPDRTKLVRSTEDALTGVLWVDDTLIVAGETTKTYGDKPGCSIVLTPL